MAKSFPTESKQVQNRLLVPLTIVLIVLFICFSFILIKFVQYDHNKSNRDLLDVATNTFNNELENQADSLAALAKSIARDSNLRHALKNLDREKLLLLHEDLYKQLRNEHSITHFYFHRPDRINLLRVHNPGKYGDFINRFTAIEAEQTNNISSGIELGPLGTFTLRTVMPIWDKGTLIGYLELGKEIEDILARIHQKEGIEIVVTISKQYLNREKWEAGMEMLGRTADWDRFSQEVLIYHSQAQYPLAFEPFTIDSLENKKSLDTVDINNRKWHALVHPLTDVAGKDIGRLIIWYDHTDQYTFMANLVKKIGMTALILLLLLFVYLWVILRQTDRTIFLQQASLLEGKNELEKTLQDLKLSQSKLLQSEKMASVGQLAAGVAHEINNPMGFISQNLRSLKKYVDKLATFIAAQKQALGQSTGYDVDEMTAMEKKLKLDYLLEDSKDLIDESLDGSDRVQTIVKNLKTFSHVDQSGVQAIDLNDCVDGTLNIIWNELKYKVSIEKDYGDLPTVNCLPQQLSQVFMNLLINASHAIDTKGIIKIRSWSDENNVYISVADDGSGISAENLEHIFEPFFTTKEVGKGTGLGLSMVYDIVKGHQGEITVASEVDKGTIFTVRLPINTSGMED